MIRIDERAPEEIKNVIHFSQTDTFWLANILSADTLRKQYDKLILKMKSMQEQKKTEDKPAPAYYEPAIKKDACPVCHGEQVIKEGNKWVKCPECGGS
jgi:DnaJ-class molecular chaperone